MKQTEAGIERKQHEITGAEMPYLYGSPLRPFWLGCGSRAEDASGGDVEIATPTPQGFLGGMWTEMPLPQSLVDDWELRQIEGPNMKSCPICGEKCTDGDLEECGECSRGVCCIVSGYGMCKPCSVAWQATQ